LTLRALLVALTLLASVAAAVGAERYGWLGVRIRDLSETEAEDLAVKLGVREGYGVMIAEIMPDTPAQTAGLRAGDLIVTIDGRPVVETRALQRLVGGTPAGRELTLVVVREGRRRELRIRVGSMPDDAVAERVGAEFGFLVRDAAVEQPGAPGAAGSAQPLVVVTVVAERSAAARGGLRVGDRIVAVDGVAVPSLDTFRRRLRDTSLRDPLRLAVERQGEVVTVLLPPAQPSALPQ
jgi:serine protease Do